MRPARRLGAAGVFALLGSAAPSWAGQQDRTAPPPEPPAEIRAYSVANLPPEPPLGIEVIGARAANPGEWPASIYHRLSDQESCTSALIGARVLLTAAHCVRDGGTLSFRMGPPGEGAVTHDAVCTRHPAFTFDNYTADYALCYVTPAVGGVRFERLAGDAEQPVLREEILLTGYGCTNLDGSGGRNGTYFIGESHVAALPGPPDNNNLIAEGKAILCFGDSGGPAFSRRGNVRYLISVNARAGRDASNNLTGRSLLASIGTPMARQFLATWVPRDHQTRPADAWICGRDPNAENCR